VSGPAPQGIRLLTTGLACPTGVLTYDAWEALRATGVVLARHDVSRAWLVSIDRAGVPVLRLDTDDPQQIAERLVELGGRDSVVWFGSADGDPGLGEALTRLLVQRSSSGLPMVEVEIVAGSWDPPGAAVLELVQVMDRLRSPGGCPWDAEQTHASLVPYVLEEAYEVAEAVESGDPAALREELGDLLLQVVFQSRVAQEAPADPFDVDDVARGISMKLRRRHPHVFADGSATTAAEVETSWDAIKMSEKGRPSVLDGVPAAMPSLARAQKILGRLQRAGLPGAPAPADLEGDVGERLFALVARARVDGVDAEAALRQAVRDAEAVARAAEPDVVEGQARGRPSAR